VTDKLEVARPQWELSDTPEIGGRPRPVIVGLRQATRRSVHTLLSYTAARLARPQGLRGSDVLLHAQRIVIHEGQRRVKTREAVRDLPIAPALERALGAHLASMASLRAW
jgi:hypothetical protein